MSFVSIRSLLLLPLLLGTALLAQVDPRLSGTNSKSDVLDVYFGSTAQGPKPEIISVIDNSASMSSLYWSRYYYADTAEAWHNSPWNIANFDGDNRIVPIVYKEGAGPLVKITVSLHWGYGAQVVVGTEAYAKGGLLIKPDGSPVTYVDAGSSDDPKDWIQRASHVRFAFTTKATASYSYGTGSYNVPNVNVLGIHPLYTSTASGIADYTTNPEGVIATSDQVRVVDLPLAWGAFDAVPYYEGQNTTGVLPDGSVDSTTARPLSPTPNWPTGDDSTARTKKHPQHAWLYDPGPVPGTSNWAWVEVDAVWSQGWSIGTTNYDGILQLSGKLTWADEWIGSSITVGSKPDYAYGKIGVFNYNADYLWWCFFGQDVRNQAGGISGGGAYNSRMVDAYSGTNYGGYAVPDVRQNGAGFTLHSGQPGNGLPCLTRFQAIKKALFQTYIKNQNDVSWAIRFLGEDPSRTAGYDSNNQNGTHMGRMLQRLQPPNSSDKPDANSTQYIVKMWPSIGTPLTAGLMNAYAQMANPNSGNSIFAADTPNCTRSFVIVLSDGAPTDAGGTNDPYIAGAPHGNKLVEDSPSSLKGGDMFNISTLAGVAAHHPLISNMWDTYTSGKVKLPWWVTTRGASTAVPRYSSTMTIGVGLSGTITDPAGSKRAMYTTALYGWEKRTDWRLDLDPSSSSYYAPDPFLSTPTAIDKLKNPFFFDASDPDGLAAALDTAIAQTRVVTNTMGAPVAPLVGLSVGKQIYLGTFTTPDGPIWNGDLLMTGLKVSGNSVQILNKIGEPISVLDASTAVWSAATAMNATPWATRKLYTLQPETEASKLPTGPAHPGAFTKTLLRWNQATSTSDLPKEVLGVTTDQDRMSVIRFMMGASDAAQAETTPEATITTSRGMMGDIISSTPAILEFPITKVPSGTNLKSYSTTGLTNVRFRVILVGDNQGIFHAFGELSGFDSGGLLQGMVEELWGFIPPDILYGINAWRKGDKHLYLMDGSPIIYLNEQGTPNGLVDGTDIVRVAFGLGKAGRSVYCLTFTDNDPSKPLMAWMIRPDEKTTATTGEDFAIKTMGYSTSKPAPSRIKKGTDLKDVFFIGGGLSTVEVDAAFSKAAGAPDYGFGSAVKLGHSILAVNVFDGTIEKYWDFFKDTTLSASFPNMGCIPAQTVPFEVLAGSYRTQRVYFSDKSGGVSVLGAKASSGVRTDTSDITSWDVRKIFTPFYSGTPVTTSPAIFYLPYGYPIARTSDPKPIQPAVGVTFITGDRNDPMDNDTINPNGNVDPNRNRLITILDRQDSADITGQLGKVDTYGFTDKPGTSGSVDLADLTTVASSTDTNISPLNTYLKTSFGYQLQLTKGTNKPAAAGTGKFYQKGVTAPIVLNGALFFSHYTPSSASTLCGGSGTTYTYRMCDVLNPIYNGSDTSTGAQATTSSSGCTNGWYVKYNDIPSELASVGLGAVIQAGEVQNADTGQGAGTILLQSGGGAPVNKIVRPRAWRIIR